DANMLAIEEEDITSNNKNLEFVFQDAGQLPRSVEQIGLSLVPGNFALASDMNLEDALVLESMNEYFRNRIVVNTEDKDSEMADDLIEAAQSGYFDQVIDEDFQGFDKPEEEKNMYELLKSVPESYFASVSTLNEDLEIVGKPLINLAVDDPDGSAPESVKAAVKNAVEITDNHKYTEFRGRPSFKARIIYFDKRKCLVNLQD